jgi:hypothetical protein
MLTCFQGQALAIEKRWQRGNNDGTIVNSRDFEEREVDLDTRAVRGNQKRDAEAEPAVRGNQKRDAEAEPAVRGNQKRDAEAEPAVRGNQKRDAEAEPAVRGNQKRDAEAEPILRTSNKARGSIFGSAVDIVARSYSSASAIIEALKTRGFSSATLLEPM